MRIDGSLEFSFQSTAKTVGWDKTAAHEHLGRTWLFGCSCEKCPRNTCKPKKRDPTCSIHSSCRAHTNDGLQAVDVACLTEDKVLYLIEVKDFANPDLSVPQNLADAHTLRHFIGSVARKFKDSLFSIWCGSVLEFDESKPSKDIATLFRCDSETLRLVFHVELPQVPFHSGLYAKNNLVTLLDIKQSLLRVIGNDLATSLFVVNIDYLNAHPDVLPWTVSR